ncbi:extracellular solute-binding protein [Sinorhizobium sp. BG8]|uniref:extracellular solute-binding protein n=1 Tax=Sinorhizobium sp. BG8 TaxID=2613773 RepID=UPI00193E703B|nr:extracellular solute-binding protein [Sinorhizobium sp. BG8]QRM57663.1 extracellular solute-binding protein [Sinorhizobium sp. BG8]
MKSFRSLASAFAILAASTTIAHAEGKLALYHWFEYIPQSLLDKFAKEYDVEVTMDTFDSNEALLAALKAGKLGTYDVTVAADYMVKILAAEGMLQPLDHAKLSNFGRIEKQWIDVPFDPGRQYSIPYQWGTTGFAVNRDAYKGDINTTDILFNPPAELKGKINMLDAQGDLLALASMHLGIPQCTSDRAQLKALNDLVMNAKADWASISSEIAKDVLVSGDAKAGMIWSGYSAKARAEGANVEYAYPRQGYIYWMDNAVLLKDAPNPENGMKFLNFLMEPENIAAISNYARFPSAIEGAEKFMDKDLLASPEVSPAESTHGAFVEACPKEVQVYYDAIWTNLKK